MRGDRGGRADRRPRKPGHQARRPRFEPLKRCLRPRALYRRRELVDLSNSQGGLTVGALFVGFARASVDSNWGGDLLHVPAITTLVALPPNGLLLTGAIPNDERLDGVIVDLQVIDLDPDAAKGVSFTPGLERLPGR